MVWSFTSRAPRSRSALGIGEIGARLRQIGLGLLEDVAVGPPVDDKKQVARLHHLAVGEIDPLEIAADARTHFDRIDGHEAADIFVLVDHQFPHRLGYGDGGGGGGAAFSLRLTLATARHSQRRERHPGETDQPRHVPTP